MFYLHAALALAALALARYAVVHRHRPGGALAATAALATIAAASTAYVLLDAYGTVPYWFGEATAWAQITTAYGYVLHVRPGWRRIPRGDRAAFAGVALFGAYVALLSAGVPWAERQLLPAIAAFLLALSAWAGYSTRQMSRLSREAQHATAMLAELLDRDGPEVFDARMRAARTELSLDPAAVGAGCPSGCADGHTYALGCVMRRR